MNITYVRNLLRDAVKYKTAYWRAITQLEIATKLDEETIESEISAFCASTACNGLDPLVTPLLDILLRLTETPPQESEAPREQQQQPQRPDITIGHPDDFAGQQPETD